MLSLKIPVFGFGRLINGPFAMTCTVMLNKSKGTHHQLVVGFIIAAATKRKKKHPPKGSKNTKEMES